MFSLSRGQCVHNQWKILFFSSCFWLGERLSNSIESANCSIIIMRTNYLNISVRLHLWLSVQHVLEKMEGAPHKAKLERKKIRRNTFFEIICFSRRLILRLYYLHRFHCVLSCRPFGWSRTMLWRNHNICIHELLEFGASDFFACSVRTSAIFLVLSTSFLHCQPKES